MLPDGVCLRLRSAGALVASVGGTLCHVCTDGLANTIVVMEYWASLLITTLSARLAQAFC